MTGMYATLRTLSANPDKEHGFGIISRHPPPARCWLDHHGLDDPEPALPVDRLLLRSARNEDDQGALLCLRCRTSHPLEDKLLALHRQFGQRHGLEVNDMASYVLDDQGDLLPLDRAPLDQSAPETSRPTTAERRYPHHPFTIEVVDSWLDDLAKLDHWARIKVEGHPSLKAYLKEHGLLLISDWALLYDSSPTMIQRSWRHFGRGGFSAERAVDLHAAFRRLYPDAKRAHRARWGRSRGWLPTVSFLKSLDPNLAPDLIFDRLRSMAAAVRCEKVGPAFAPPEALDQLAAPEPEPEPDIDSPLLTPLRDSLTHGMATVLGPVLAGADPETELQRCLWSCYAEGLSQRECASRCSCSQGKVSRRMALESRLTAIATEAAVFLSQWPEFASISASVAGVERLVAELRNHLTMSEQGGDGSILGPSPFVVWLRRHLALDR